MPKIIPPEEDGKYVQVFDSASEDATSEYSEVSIMVSATDSDE